VTRKCGILARFRILRQSVLNVAWGIPQSKLCQPKGDGMKSSAPAFRGSIAVQTDFRSDNDAESRLQSNSLTRAVRAGSAHRRIHDERVIRFGTSLFRTPMPFASHFAVPRCPQSKYKNTHLLKVPTFPQTPFRLTRSCVRGGSGRSARQIGCADLSW
jgi:hypothetical protein